MTNTHNTVLYTGVTSRLIERISQHVSATTGFTAKYRIKKLVYVETVENSLSAIEREKEIKGWRRQKKVALIESINPFWRDLLEELNG